MCSFSFLRARGLSRVSGGEKSPVRPHHEPRLNHAVRPSDVWGARLAFLTDLAWTPTCNCATSGSLTGTVSGGGKDDGKAATVTITGCGTAEVTIDGDSESVTRDRCAAI